MLTRREVVALSFGGMTTNSLAETPRSKFSAPSALLADLQQRTFRFFWETTDPDTGLAPDRWPTRSLSSIAAVGFALTAYPIGVANGWISRSAARQRTLSTLRFFAHAPQGPQPIGRAGYRGFFYHFLSMDTGTRFESVELSTIDTALLLGGVLFAQSWFDGDDAGEAEIRRLADEIYRRVEWTWIRPRAPFVSMGWNPETGFIQHDWNRYTESLLLYVLALGSPTYSLDREDWEHWTDTFDLSWGSHFGEPHIGFAPLFGHQYSHIWIDFLGIRDAYGRKRELDYFENSRRATFAQRNYATRNPESWAGYGSNVWGLTACDGPGNFKQIIAGRERQFFSYTARGPLDRDDGTLAPTACVSSIPFAPKIVVPALREMHRKYGKGIYGQYGFWDSFNPTLVDANELQHGRFVADVGWVDGDHLGINQGPIVAMLEKYSTGMIWKTMRSNPHIRRGLNRAGFTGGGADLKNQPYIIDCLLRPKQP